MTGGNLRNLLAQASDWSRSPAAWEASFKSRFPLTEDAARDVGLMVALAPEAVQLLADMAEWVDEILSKPYRVEERWNAGSELLARFGRIDQQAGQQ